METPTKRKYTYFAIIQHNYGNGWEDVNEYPSQSNGTPLQPDKFNDELQMYEDKGYHNKVIIRKQINNLKLKK